MSQSLTLHSDSACIQDFHRWIIDNSISHTGRHAKFGDPAFLPRDKLEEYLESNDHINLTNLLVAFYKGKPVQVDPKQILSSYSKVFSILFRIGKEHFLPRFVAWDSLKDSHLPFSIDEQPAKFPVDPACVDFYKRFCTEQWRFCAPQMEFSYTRSLDENCILPITSKELIWKCTSSEIYKITLYPLYNSLLNMVSYKDI